MPKETKQLEFLHRTWKGWLLQAWGPFILRRPPTSVIQNVWQTSLQFNKCVTAEEESRKKCQRYKRTMYWSIILTVAKTVQRQARISWKEQAELRRKFTSLTGRGGWSTASAGLSDSTLSVWGGSVSVGGSVWVGVGLGHASSLSVLSSATVWDLVLAGTVWGALEHS